MLSRLCSTNSAKAVAFLYGDQLLCAGVGSELRVYSCSSFSSAIVPGDHGAVSDSDKGSAEAAVAEEDAETRQDRATKQPSGKAGRPSERSDSKIPASPCGPPRPFNFPSGLLVSAPFSSATHILGLSASSTYIAAYGLGHLVLYQLQWIEGSPETVDRRDGEETRTRASVPEDSRFSPCEKAQESCSETSGAGVNSKAARNGLLPHGPHVRAQLSQPFRYASRHWILDVRILQNSAARVERNGEVDVNKTSERQTPPALAPFLLVGTALGRVDLLDSGASTLLASWTCTDRSLLYSLAVHIPLAQWSSGNRPAAPENKYALADDAADGRFPPDTRGTHFAATQSCTSITVASGTVYSSILLWNLVFPQSQESRCFRVAPRGEEPEAEVSRPPESSDSGHSPAGGSESGKPCVNGGGSPDPSMQSIGNTDGQSSQVPLSDFCGASTNRDSPRSVAPRQVLRGHRGVIFKVCFYLDGLLLCSASDDREVRLWWKSSVLKADGEMQTNAGKGEGRDKAEKRNEEVSGADKGRALPSGLESLRQKSAAAPGSVCVLESKCTESGYACVATLKGHRSRVWDIALLDVSSGRSFAFPGTDPQGTSGAGLPVHVSSDRLFEEAQRRYFIVSAGEDSSCRIWSLRGEFLYSLLGHAGRGVRAVCTPEQPTAPVSRRVPLIASGGEDGDVKLWSLGDSPTFGEVLESHCKRLGQPASGLAMNSSESGTERETERGERGDNVSCQSSGAGRRTVVWNCRDHSGPNDFVREVRLLDTDSALVATNFGCVFFLSLSRGLRHFWGQKGSGVRFSSLSHSGDSSQIDKASPPLGRENEGDCVAASFLLVKVPAVLTCLRVLDGLVTAGCADGTVVGFVFCPRTLNATESSRDPEREANREMEPALEPPKRWSCFQRARVGNLFQIALPASHNDVCALQRPGLLGGLHAAARSTFSTKSFWSEVRDHRNAYGKTGTPATDLRSTSVTGTTHSGSGGARVSHANGTATDFGEPHDLGDTPTQHPVENIVVATDHTGVVSLWAVSTGRGKKQPDAVSTLSEERQFPDRIDGAFQRSDEDTPRAADALHRLHAEPVVEWVASAQLPHAGRSKTDASRCFSCLGLLCVEQATSRLPEATGSGADGAAGENTHGSHELSILIVLGDEGGSLHVVQAVVPERTSAWMGGELQAEPHRSERSVERHRRATWAWSEARSRLAHSLKGVHKGKKVWDVVAQGHFLLSCGGDGTILLLRVTKQKSDGVTLSRSRADRLGQDGEVDQRGSEDKNEPCFPFAVTLCPVSCVRVPQLTLMYSLVPTETAPLWWSENDGGQSEGVAGSPGGDVGPLRHNWLCAFRTADFVLFDLRTSMELMRVRCGNSRRPLDFHREHAQQYTFTSAMKHLLYFHVHGRAASPSTAKMPSFGVGDPTTEANCNKPAPCAVAEDGRTSGETTRERRNQSDTSAPRELPEGSSRSAASSDDLSAHAATLPSLLEDTRRSASFNPGFHGREVWSVCWLDEETLATGGEDNSVKIISIVDAEVSRHLADSNPRDHTRQLGHLATANPTRTDGGNVTKKIRGSFPDRTDQKQLDSDSPRSLGGTQLLCTSSATPSKWHFQVIQTGVHHTAAVRSVRLLGSLPSKSMLLESQTVPQMLVSVGARNIVNLFFVSPPAPRSSAPGGVSATLSQKNNPLRISHALSARLSNRGQGTEVRLNGVDGFVERDCLSKPSERNKGEVNTSEFRDGTESLTVHMWTAASSAEVAYVEATLVLTRSQEFGQLAHGDRSRNSRLEKRASCPLEGAALCVRVVCLDTHANDAGGCSFASSQTEFGSEEPSRTNTHGVLVLVGMTTGEIAVFLGDTSAAVPRLERLGTLHAHQCGVNDLEVAETQNALGTKVESGASVATPAGLGSSALAESEMESPCYCVASCGDDQSVTVQFICVEHKENNASLSLRLISACRVENAHASSARSCSLLFPLLFTVGWDRWVQVWTIRPGVASGGCDGNENSSSRLVKGAEPIQRSCATRKPSLTAQRLNARSRECQQRRYWGESTTIDETQIFSVERVDAIKTSVADAAHLDGKPVPGGVRVCVVGSSGGIECFQFRE
ncbi:WD domain, G-beta repeat-containing protein [Toxoplasma gondii GT1]|uniref:WD domain, G-beta repeat-containing protein n=2 Tax=Toxoplasma gondii TaxID=5811 RepID=S7W804_TOXGG|nr:WD domain, G-beta repeat-containing protein [Toxoplasma gondii GT1]KAF4639222.1 WD domain, G-beta repeat-containing protein [Toxoplasma gondii]